MAQESRRRGEGGGRAALIGISEAVFHAVLSHMGEGSSPCARNAVSIDSSLRHGAATSDDVPCVFEFSGGAIDRGADYQI
jgi:hypothetical protein